MRHINVRLYHPQSQGRVERFNRSVVEFFKRTISKEETWSEQLPYFYYQYNNRVNKATRPSTPFRLFFGRPNMDAPTTEQVDINNLTPEERLFLQTSHIDVDIEEDNHDAEYTNIHENTPDVQTTIDESAPVEHNDSLTDASAYYQSIYTKLFLKDFPLETFNQQKTGQLKPTVGLVVDFRPNPALSVGTSALTSGHWRKRTVVTLSSHPTRGAHGVSA